MQFLEEDLELTDKIEKIVRAKLRGEDLDEPIPDASKEKAEEPEKVEA
jgi:hypothetical protein